MFHAVEANQGACTSQASLAMDSYRSSFSLSGRKELRYNLIRWSSAVNEEQVQVLDALLGELALLILGFVEAHHERHSHSFEDGHVVVWGKRSVSVRHVKWSRERNELAWDDPVKVTVFDFLKVLILLDIEGRVVIPAEGNRVLESLETVQVGASVSTVTHSGVAVRNELIVIGAEH